MLGCRCGGAADRQAVDHLSDVGVVAAGDDYVGLARADHVDDVDADEAGLVARPLVHPRDGRGFHAY